MGKKKPSGGKNKTERTPVQMPKDWLAIARARASTKRQPVLWYIISLIEDDARKVGVTKFPPAPWNKDGVEASPPAVSDMDE